MTQQTFPMPDPGERMTFTGERYTTGLQGDIQSEHYHRYLFALRLCDGRDVLDVASGEGYGAALIAGVARSVIGVDIDHASVTFAARAYARDNLSFRVGSALALPMEDASVDVVVSFETIEHLADHATFLKEVKRVLRPDGVFAVSTPDRRIYSEEPSYSNPYHVRELSRDEFAELLGASFRQVQLYEQQVVAGSVLARPEETGGGTESYAAAEQSFQRRVGLPRPPYLVAVAADSLPDLPGMSLLHGLVTDEAIRRAPPSAAPTADAPRTEATLREEVSDLRRRLLDANLSAGEVKRRLFEMDRERGYLRAMLTQARRVADTARAETIHARVTFESEVAAVRAAVEAEAAQRIAEATASVAAAEARHQEWINALRRSRSWRLTRPFRVLSRLARRVLH